VLPSGKPPYVQASKRSIANAYILEAVGLASDQVWGVTIDDKVALEQIHPTYSLALLPLTDDIVLSFEDALFYADCFAYEHEIPVIPHPRKDTWQIEFLVSRQGKKESRDTFIREMCTVLECVHWLRLGPLGYVEFRHDGRRHGFSSKGPRIRLRYTQRYGPARREIHLYSMALRQIDPLSDYLCFYRVIESASASNGRKWLERNLVRLAKSKFGMLPAGDDFAVRKRRINLFTVLRRRAVSRLEQLLNRFGTCAEVAEKLYRTNRCGIAHGESIRRSDFSTDFTDVYMDCFVVRLMARLAIKDKICGKA